MDKLKTIINNILEEAGKSQIDELNASQHLQNDIGFDSLELAELTVNIEAEFGVDIFLDGIVTTIGEILNKIDA